MKPRTDETSACWICDYWPVILGLILVIAVGLALKENWLPVLAGSGSDTPLQITPAPLNTLTPDPTLPSAVTLSPASTSTRTPRPASTATPRISPTPSRPVFRLAFVPLNWSGSPADFDALARRHAAMFFTESAIDHYFAVEVAVLASGLENADLASPNLLADVVEFGSAHESADLYVGLTDGDINLGGISDLAGWTMGPGSGGAVVETASEITAHELGHIYGLCDEYSYSVWAEENLEFPSGCPNPFPDRCPRDNSEEAYCGGAPAPDGRNSFMGAAGQLGGYAFNQPSLDHLQQVFSRLAQEASQ